MVWKLWFDVEKRYNTTRPFKATHSSRLWFDVEKRYNTTVIVVEDEVTGCGLM